MQAFSPSSPSIAADAGGVLRVGGTRVSLDSVAAAFDAGATAEEVAQRYPSLDLATVYEVFAYLLRNRAGVEAYLRSRSTEVARTQDRLEARFPADGLRARLLARRGDERRDQE